MPQGKGTYGSKVGRPKKKGNKITKAKGNPKNKNIMDTPMRKIPGALKKGAKAGTKAGASMGRTAGKLKVAKKTGRVSVGKTPGRKIVKRKPTLVQRNKAKRNNQKKFLKK